MDAKSREKNPEHQDPITGATGAHPVGTGLGAAAGGAAGIAAASAAAGTAAGPAGMATGIAVGAVAGGLVGHGIGEAISPSEEETYWRDNHSRQWYAGETSYEDYQDAYRLGYEGYARHGVTGRTYDELEPDFQREYESRASGRISWEKAKRATKAAWNRVAGNFHRLIGYHVEDAAGGSVGKVHNLWTAENGQPVFVGVKTGWLFGKNHVVPASGALVNDRRKIVQLPFTEDQIKNAPVFDESADISDYDQDRIFTYFGVTRPAAVTPSSWSAEHMEETPPRPAEPTNTGRVPASEGAQKLQLKEEELKIGKRVVEAGGIRLHKVVRTETVTQPVELQREEIVIERVPAGEARAAGERFDEQDIFIPLHREEPVIQKEARVREEVRVGKKTEVDQRQVSEQVRKEDLQVDRNDTAPPGR